MMANLKYWLKGLAVAALSMVVYAGALGCYIALMLLVISMEEGGDNLSAFSVSLTEAVVPRERFQNRIHHFDDYAVAAYGFADRSYRIARQTRRNESVRMRGRNHRLGVDQCVLRQ